MPGAVPFTSTIALTNATLPYAVEIATKGWENAVKSNVEIKRGLNMVNGLVTYEGVADAFNLKYTPAETVL
jgi:alanine dehydrogenase